MYTVVIHKMTRSYLQGEPVAADFWRQGLEVGLGTTLATLASSFPLDQGPLVQLCRSLALAGPDSAKRSEIRTTFHTTVAVAYYT